MRDATAIECSVSERWTSPPLVAADYTRSLIESNIDALMTTDPLGIITDVNKQMVTLTGYSRDDLIGSPFKNYFTDPRRAEEGIRLVLRGEARAELDRAVDRSEREVASRGQAASFEPQSSSACPR